jgi:hypothetical protein
MESTVQKFVEFNCALSTCWLLASLPIDVREVLIHIRTGEVDAVGLDDSRQHQCC